MDTDIASIIISLKTKDEKLRTQLMRKGELSNGYNEEMEALHIDNAKELDQIIQKIGYPTKDKVGKAASDAAWLVIQHSISQPDFMKKCAKLLSEVVNENKSSQIKLAYLKDRIAVFEGKPQLYGTQFDWNKNGELCPNPYVDLNKVNQRRISIGLNTLEEQILIIQKRAKNEDQTPPTDLEERTKEYDNWRKSVGWIN